MTHALVGIDISKDFFDFHHLGEHKRRSSTTLPNSPDGWARLALALQGREVRIAMEATSTYHLDLAHFALEQGWQVYVFNPYKVRCFANSKPTTHKSDAHDAWLLAEFLRANGHDFAPYTRQSECFERLQGLTRRRRAVMQMRVMESNRLHANHHTCPDVRQDLEESIRQLDERLTKLDERCEALLEESEELRRHSKRLEQIPAVGRVLALGILAELGDMSRFTSAKQPGQVVGLVPIEISSGTSVSRKGKLMRGGNARLRSTLYMAAMSAMRTGAWEPWIERRKERGKDGIRLLVAIMDKILRLAYGVIRHDCDFDEKIAFAA